MPDIIVTTPKSEMRNAALEAKECIDEGGGSYFRTLATFPKRLNENSRIFYVEDGYIRGYFPIHSFDHLGKNYQLTCATTGRAWGGAVNIIMDATQWKWIKPIAMKGFQGWRYYEPPPDLDVVGDWLDPRPRVQG